MSCANPAVEHDALMPSKPKFDKSRTCIKCKLATGNIVVRHAVYCKECFIPHISHKLSKVLDPAVDLLPGRKTFNPAGNLLIACSGGLASTVMLDIVYQVYFAGRQLQDDARGEPGASGGIQHPRHGPVWKRAAVCYVETCAADHKSTDKTEAVRSAISAYPSFEFVHLRLEDAFDPAWWARMRGTPIAGPDLALELQDEDLLLSTCAHSTPVARLNAYLSALPTPTARASSIATLVRVLLFYTARARNASHLLLGTSGTALSIGLISAVAQGGGFALPAEIGEEWDPGAIAEAPVSTNGETADEEAATLSGAHGKKAKARTPLGHSWTGAVRVVRPLRDVSNKECAAFARWRGLQLVNSRGLGDMDHTGPTTNVAKGIGGLTRDFIIGLERDYPSTVSTIARTCGKLGSKDDGQAAKICVICERPVQRTVHAWKERISIRALSSGASYGPATVSGRSLAPHVCYACHTTLTSRSSKSGAARAQEPVALPVWTQARMQMESGGGESKGGGEGEGGGATMGEGEIWGGRAMGVEEMRREVEAFLIDD